MLFLYIFSKAIWCILWELFFPFVGMFLVLLVLLLSAARLIFSILFFLFCAVSCRRQTLFCLFGELTRFLCPVRFILLFKVMFPNEFLVPFHFLLVPLNFFCLRSLSKRTSLWNLCGYLRFPICITRLFCLVSCKAETSTLPTWLVLKTFCRPCLCFMRCSFETGCRN